MGGKHIKSRTGFPAGRFVFAITVIFLLAYIFRPAVWGQTSIGANQGIGPVNLSPYTNPVAITGTQTNGADAINNVNWDGLVDSRTYGVKCDGATDDTANLQTALNSSAGVKVILPPAKTCVIAGTLTVGSSTVPATLDLTGSRLKCTGTAGNDCIEIAQFGHLTCDGYGNGAANTGCQIASTSTSLITSLVTNADHSTPQTNFDLRHVLLNPATTAGTITKGTIWLFALEGFGYLEDVHVLAGPTSSLRVESGSTGNLFINAITFVNDSFACGASANPCVYLLSNGVFFSNLTFVGGAIVDATGSGPLLSIQGGATAKINSIIFDGTYFESKAGGTGDFIDVGDAQNIIFNGVDFNGGPTLPNCLYISQSGLGNAGNIRLYARATSSQCTNYVNNTITSYTSSVAGDLNYVYQGSTNPVATNTIDGPQTFNNLVVQNGVKEVTVAKSINFNFTTTTQNIICTAGAGGVIGTLPAATGSGQHYRMKKIDSAAGNCVANASTNGGTVDGASTDSIAIQYTSHEYVDGGSNLWYVF